MKPIAKINFQFNGVFYDKGDEVEVTTKEQLVKLNEKGFINSLTPKEIQDFGKKKIIREVDENGTSRNTR